MGPGGRLRVWPVKRLATPSWGTPHHLRAYRGRVRPIAYLLGLELMTRHAPSRRAQENSGTIWWHFGSETRGLPGVAGGWSGRNRRLGAVRWDFGHRWVGGVGYWLHEILKMGQQGKDGHLGGLGLDLGVGRGIGGRGRRVGCPRTSGSWSQRLRATGKPAATRPSASRPRTRLAGLCRGAGADLPCGSSEELIG